MNETDDERDLIIVDHVDMIEDNNNGYLQGEYLSQYFLSIWEHLYGPVDRKKPFKFLR